MVAGVTTQKSSEPPPPLHLHNVTARSGAVFKLVGHVGSQRFTALVDSGASGSGFINPAFAARCGLALSPSANSVQLADGQCVPAAGQVAVSYTLAPTTGAPISFTSTFTATPLESYDIILGVGWLADHDVLVGWNSRSLEVRSPGRASRHIRPLEVIGTAASNELASISIKALRKEMRAGRIQECYAVLIRPAAESPSAPASAAAAAAAAPAADADIAALLKEFADVFPAKLPDVLPPMRGVEHSIPLKDGAKPPACRPLRQQSAKDSAVIDEFLKAGIASGRLRDSHSPYGSMLLIVKKKDGSPRVCVDYRAINEITVKNKYPLPLMDELFDRVQGARFFSKIDLRDGFFQIRLAESDIEKTAFRTRFGSYEYTVLPMGLCNAPSTFMAMMNDTFRDLLDKSVLCFLDDILIFSKTREEHIAHVREVLTRLRKAQLYGKLSKCEFMRDEVEFLGHRLGKDGLAVSPDKVAAVRDWPALKNVKDVRSFLGLAGFYRRFVKDFSKVALPLTELTHEKVAWEWGALQQESFAALKSALCSAPVLVLPDPSLPYVLNCDACDYAIGATLQQDHGNGLQPVAFRSKKLSPAERNYDTREKEFMALVDACSHWRHYLHSDQPFTLLTDHDSLKYHKTMPNLSGRLARWIEKMSEFEPYTIQHIAGAKNVVADALSRRSDLQWEATEQQLNAAAVARARRAPPPPDSPAVAADRQRNKAACETSQPRDPALPPLAGYQKGAILTPSQQCTANTKAGHHCGQRTAVGQYCWNHLRTEVGLRVKKSDVPRAGRGLFAARPLPAGTRIPYTGDIVLLPRGAGGDYVLETRTNADGVREGIDAARRNSGYGRWVNDPKGSRHAANSQFVCFTPPGGRQRVACVRTLRPLAIGEEVLVSYGAQYWRFQCKAAPPRKILSQISELENLETASPAAPAPAEHAGTDAESALTLAPLSVARPSSELTPRIVAAARADIAYQQMVAAPPPGTSAVNGVLFEGERMVVPADAALRTSVLTACHDAVTGAHFGRDKTLSAVQRRFTWKGLATDVDNYVATCDACQRNKPSQQLTAGPLMPLPIPERPCQEWTTDAVTGLPKTQRGNDAIQVYVERLCKLKHFAATRSTDGASEMARDFVKNVVRLHGVPESLVSDRDPRLTAHFHRELSRLIGVTHRFSTARHAQTDGQSEREIKTLITALRAFCNDHRDDWDDYLDMLELGFNSAVQSSTQRSPFELVFGNKPRLPIDVAVDALAPPRVPAAADRAARMKAALEFVHTQLGVAQAHQARNADAHRRSLKLSVGDHVLLSTDGLQLRNFTNKLCSRYVGPFAITKEINANAFELALPRQMQALHPVFNISRLKLYRANSPQFATRPLRFDRPPPVAERDSNGDAVFEVERIVAARHAGRRKQWLVQWKGYPPEESTWESRAALGSAREALAEFEASQADAAADAGDASAHSLVLSSLSATAPSVPPVPSHLELAELESYLSSVLRGLRPLISGGM